MSRLLFIIIFLLLVSCTNNDASRNNKKPDPDNIYFHYRIWGDEESGIVTMKLQYHNGGPNGNTVLLEEPAKVELDGNEIEASDAKFNGVYYEAIMPVNEFAGNHVIVFTAPDKKKYEAEFDYPVIALLNELPAVVKRDSIVLKLSGTKPGDKIIVLLNDTSFYGGGIEKADTLEDSRIVITKKELGVLKNGPVYLELFREEEKKFDEATSAGGIFLISYGIKREFMLETPVP